jgi:ABC-type nitrate/sulfonate/bicarbonate transport system substrate-binding protein
MRRRDFLGYSSSLAASAAGVLLGPRRARAQGLTKVRFTLSWVAEGSSLPLFVARNKGYWKTRGLDVDISRGYGSSASTVALASDKFDFAYAITSVMILQVGKGLPLQSIGQLTYRNTMGVCVLADSPIKSPKDLEGKTVGITPSSGEVPFIPVYAKNAGVDYSKIKFVSMNLDVRYRALMEKQIDAMTDTGISAIPPLVSQGFPVRFMLFSDHGMDMYASSLMTTPKMVKEKPEVCQAFVDGVLDAVAYTLLNPAEALDIFIKEVPEAALTSKGRDSVRLGMGIFNWSALSEDARKNGLGWTDPKMIALMNDLVADYIIKGAAKPAVEDLYTNRFAGRLKLTEAQWQAAKKHNEEFQRFFS